MGDLHMSPEAAAVRLAYAVQQEYHALHVVYNRSVMLHRNVTNHLCWCRLVAWKTAMHA